MIKKFKIFEFENKEKDFKKILSHSYICFNNINQARRIIDELREIDMIVNENFGGIDFSERIPQLFNCFVSFDFKTKTEFIPSNENFVFNLMSRAKKLEYTRFSYTEFLKLLGYEIKGNLLNDPYGEEEWDLDESINNDLDPYDEEDWHDSLLINPGDEVECIKSESSMRGIIDKYEGYIRPDIKAGKKYKIKQINLFNPSLVYLFDNEGVFHIDSFRKLTNEHIHYLMDDDDDDYEPPKLKFKDEIIEVVCLPTGTYFTIKKKKYTEALMKYITWSERLKMYVCRDKDLNKIKLILDPDSLF